MIDFTAFHFLRPDWFWALAPLSLLLIAVFYLHNRQSGWQGVLASHLYQHLVASKSAKQQRPPLTLIALGWVLAVVALAGPTWQKLPQPVYQLNSGKVVLIDMSLSMRSTDISPNRLTRAKYKAIDLIQQADEGDIGLVAYAGDAFTISPLSSDGQNLTALLPSLTPEIMPVAGSEPYLGLTSAAELLKNAGYLEGEIFWITDGVEMSQLAELNQTLAALPYRVSILGVGTAQGAPIQLANGDFLKDARGAIVVPKMQSSVLQGLANKAGGQYSTITASDQDIKRLLEQRLVNRDSEQDEQQSDQFGDKWKEAGPYLLLLLLPLAALAFRRGYIMVCCLALSINAMTPSPAYAVSWQDWFKNDDQQAKQAFSQDNFEQAAEQFNDPLWKSSALYKSGDYQAAVDALANIDSEQAHYNKGNALAQLGELDSAIEAYDQALTLNPDNQDALHNKQLLEQLKQQQEQQQQQQDQNQQQQNEEQQSQSDQQQSSDSSQSDSQDQQSEGQPSSDQTESSAEQPPQDNQQPPQDTQQGEQDSSQQEQEPQQASGEQQNEKEQDDTQQQAQMAEQSAQPMTDEERENMQKMQNLLNKVPDDPAFLLKRKMMLENQKRRRQNSSPPTQRNW